MPSLSQRDRLLLGGGLLSAALLLSGAASLSPSLAVFNDAATMTAGTVKTRAACANGTAYPAAVLAQSPTFYWRFGETPPPAVTSVADATPQGLNGTPQGTGLTFGATGLLTCDGTAALRLAGANTSTGFVVQRTAVPNTDVFTIAAWIRTGSARGGWILGMGGARWGTSTNRDRVLYLQPNGHPTFSVGITTRHTIAGTAPVNDGQPHMLVATLGPDGMKLYVDGALVASDSSVTKGAQYTGNEPADPTPPANPATPDGYGYWRVGYDSVAGLGPVTPTRNQLGGRIDEVAVWQNRALSAGNVSALYAQNHW